MSRCFLRFAWAVPLDMNTLKALKRSTLEKLDVFVCYLDDSGKDPKNPITTLAG